MRIKRDGIFRTIDSKDYGIWQAMGFEKVVTKSVKVEEPKVEEPTMAELELITEEIKIEEPKEEIVVPKPKKRKKLSSSTEL